MKRSLSVSKDPIPSWPQEDQPREKLLAQGEHVLTDSELLAIVLRTGRDGESALDLARVVLKEAKGLKSIPEIPFAQLTLVKGIGLAKVAQIKAAIELGRRSFQHGAREKNVVISSAEDVFHLVGPSMALLRKEVVRIVFLNARNQVIAIDDTAQGTVNEVFPIVREIFLSALSCGATGLICVHNHPSGEPSPSNEDKQFTEQLYHAGQVLGVEVFDHIIIGDHRYYSFADPQEE